MKTFLVTLLAIFMSWAVLAAPKAELFVWQYSASSAKLVLLKTGNQTYEEAAQKYLAAYNKNKDLKKLSDGNLKFLFDDESFRPLSADPVSKDPRFVVLVTDPYQAKGAVTSKNWYRGLENAGADVYVLPTNGDVGLKKSDAALYRKLVAESFDGLLLLGGEDIDPAMYGEDNTESEDINTPRDESAIAMVKAYIKAEKGSVFGICRGMQVIAVATGYKMIQDIKSDLPETEIHHPYNDHLIRLLPGSYLSRAFGAQKVIEVNSIHHQAVDIDAKSGPLKVIARAVGSNRSSAKPKEDPESEVIEAVELKNGHGFAVQFHPEHVYNKTLGRKVFGEMVRVARSKSKVKKTCSAQLEAD